MLLKFKNVSKSTKQEICYEARVLQKCGRTRAGYFLGTCTLEVLLYAYPRRTQIFQQQKKSFSFIFSFGYVTKIDK